MRFAVIAILLIIQCTPGLTFEIEEQRSYAPSGATAKLSILSTADVHVFEPIIISFQNQYPGIAIQYDVAVSTDVMAAVKNGNDVYDLVISSAMDLQTKLANDGFAQEYVSDTTLSLPNWANWRDQLFAFTREPAVVLVSKKALRGLSIPINRDELIALLRSNTSLFHGKIGTYDVRSSGLGYLFATQDSRNTDSYWRLMEVLGRLDTKLYCCSGQMIRDIASGKLLLGYNVLGSYSQLDVDTNSQVLALEMGDHTSVMLRTALIPKTARNKGDAGRFIDFLLELRKHPTLLEKTGLSPIGNDALLQSTLARPIRLGPGLLVFLDKFRRENFLRSWSSAIIQN